MSDLAAHGEEGAAALFVVLAGVFVGAVDVGLVAAEEPLGAGDFDAAVVDAGVAVVGDAEFGFELEVLGRAAAPDEEAVLLEEIVGVTSPMRMLFSTRQYCGSPSQFLRVPSKMGWKPSLVSVSGCG